VLTSLCFENLDLAIMWSLSNFEHSRRTGHARPGCEGDQPSLEIGDINVIVPKLSRTEARLLEFQAAAIP
jgi:hypothetical protein